MRVVPQSNSRWGVYGDDGVFITGGLTAAEVWERFPAARDDWAEQAIAIRVADAPGYAIAYAALMFIKTIKKPE